MDQIKKYRNSPVNIISLKYEGEAIIINLAKATKINENDIEAEIKNQPSYYAFLGMLHKKLLTKFELAKLNRKSTIGRLMAIARDKKGPSGRFYSESDAKAWVESRPKYIKASQRCIRARDEADQLYTAVRAFEQRANLLQTLSSNLRRERS